MPLTVLPHTVSTPDDLVRLFHQSQLEWSRHLGEETELDFGRWIHNSSLPDCDAANCLLDAFLFPGVSPSELLAEMSRRCKSTDVPWRFCSLNPSVPLEQTTPLIDHLLQNGWQSAPLEILYRARSERLSGPVTPPDITVIPARAGYRLYRQLMEQRDAVSADLAEMHLDDSHVDSLLALRGQQPVGCISVLTSGEVGTVREWYVGSDHRNCGIGRLLLNRALEICARSLLRHVMIGMPPENSGARRLTGAFGFQKIGEWKTMRADTAD